MKWYVIPPNNVHSTKWGAGVRRGLKHSRGGFNPDQFELTLISEKPRTIGVSVKKKIKSRERNNKKGGKEERKNLKVLL